MDPATQINDILKAFAQGTGEVLGLPADQVYLGRRRTGEGEGAAAYVNASVVQIVPGTVCTERMTVALDIGFQLPIDASKGDSVQRIASAMGLRNRFVKKGASSIPNVGLTALTDMSLTDPEDPDSGFYAGGIALQFQTDIERA